MANEKAKAPADAGQAEIQKTFDEAEKKGYFGERVENAVPNSAYTLQSGPDAPSMLEEHVTFHGQRVDAMRASAAKEAK